MLVEAERPMIPYLEVRVRGDRMFVCLKSGVRYNPDDTSQRVEVTLPVLTRASAGNHSTMRLDGLGSGDILQHEATDFSTLRASIAAGELRVEVSNHLQVIHTFWRRTDYYSII